MQGKAGKLIIFSVLVIVISCAGVRGDEPPAGTHEVAVVRLKNKGKISGIVVFEGKGGVALDTGYGIVSVSRDDIAAIDFPEGDEKKKELKKRESYLSDGKIDRKLEEETKRKIQERHEEYRRIRDEIAERARKSREHRIKFSDSSRIPVKAVLNGEVETTLLVDTGATFVLIPYEITDQLFEKGTDLSRRIEGKLADGTIREGIPVVLRSVEIGSMKAENVEAVVMDLKGESGLLGMSFLNRFDLRIDSDNKELVIKKK